MIPPARRLPTLARPGRLLMIALALLGGAAATQALAQVPLGETPGSGPGRVSLWSLFWASADLFTILLVAGSIIAAAVIARCIIEIRPRYILSDHAERTIRQLAAERRWTDLHAFVQEDETFPSLVVRAALNAPATADDAAAREAAEMAASEQCAQWFRRVEPLNVIGTLGPLLGLAGTVWGMIIAFASLGEAGGRAAPGDLSLGISKALFHTLLGLMLAVPSLAALGFYRSRVDSLCTRALVTSSQLVETILCARQKL